MGGRHDRRAKPGVSQGAAWLETVATVRTGWMASNDRRIPVAGEVDDGRESAYA